jgi:two-component system, LytTR family, response regulator
MGAESHSTLPASSARVSTAMDVIIVDDEPAARRALREFCVLESDLNIVGEYGSASEALDAVRDVRPDVLFLDIQIGTTNGVELARSLAPDEAPIIVFVTAHNRYAIDAFEVSAIDYLLKPFDAERFHKTLVRVRRRYEVESAAERQAAFSSALEQLTTAAQNRSELRPRLLAESGGHMRMVDVADVELVEGDRNYVRLTLGRDVYHVRSTLQQAERVLQVQPILRISRSCLVNVNHVREVGRTPRGDFIFVLAGGATVTSSEGFRDVVRQYLAQFKVGSTEAVR